MMQVIDAPIESLQPDPTQPRKSFEETELKELATSLLTLGQLVPVLVMMVDNRYVLLDGERRYLAAKMARLPKLRAVVVDEIPDETTRCLAQLAINCVRSDVPPLDRMQSYQHLMQAKGWNATELAKNLGISKANVTRYLSHASLPPEIQSLMKEGKLSSAKAYALSRLPPEELAQSLTDIAELPNREQLERRVRKKTERGQQTVRTLKVELPQCSLAVRASKSMTVDEFLNALADLIKACKKAKSLHLDMGTMAMVICDNTRAKQSEGLDHETSECLETKTGLP